MANELDAIAQSYRSRYRPDRSVADRMRELYMRYLKAKEQSLLDAASSATATAALYADRVDISEMPPRVAAAFHAAFPNMTLRDVEAHHAPAELISAWKGKLFEIEVRDRLNAGEWVGDRHLLEGQSAVLADSPTQAGWDLRILDANGVPLEGIQLKATESASYIKRALEHYPDIEILATSDTESVAELSGMISHANVSEAEMRRMVVDPLEPVLDGPITDIAESILPGLPFMIIALQSGRKVMAGRTTFLQAAGDAAERMAQASVAMGVGWLVADILGNAGAAAATAFAVRLYFLRSGNLERAREIVSRHRQRLEQLNDVRGNRLLHGPTG